MRHNTIEKSTKTRMAILTILKSGDVSTTRAIHEILGSEISYQAVSNCLSGMVPIQLVEDISIGWRGKFRITKRGLDMLAGKDVPRLTVGKPPEFEPVLVVPDFEVMSEYDANLFDQVAIRYDEIIADLLARIEALEETVTTPAPMPTQLLVPEPKVRKPSVFLGGAKPAQGFIIAKEFREQFDVRCVSSDDLNKWRSMAKNCDHVLAMQGFISHKHTETLQSAGKDIHFVSGMTDIRDTLTKLYVEGE